MISNGPGFAAGFSISNPAIGAGALVVLGAIGAHLISDLFGKSRATTVAKKTSEPTMMQTMFGEAQAMATDPTIVQRNADRVNEAIKQRRDHLVALREKAHDGQISPYGLAEGIQRHVQDVLDQLEIPQHPHPTSTTPDLLQLFKNQRVDQMARRFAVPGGLILDPEERAWLEHQSMSYQGYADPAVRLQLRDALKNQAEQQRLAAYRSARHTRETAIREAFAQRDAAQDLYVLSQQERKRARL